MEVKTLPFRNFSENTTDEQLATDTQIGITGAICCIIWLIVLVVQTVFALCYSHKIWGTAIKRLAVGLTASTMLYGLVLTLHLVRYFYPKIGHFCEVVGFLAHYFVSVEILFTMCICLLMFYKILKVITSWKFEYCESTKWSTCTCCDRKINKLEAALFASVFVLPLLLDWIPFTTNSYGPSGYFCYFHVEKNCSELTCTAGLWEDIWLSSVPFGFVAVLTLLLFTTSLCLLGYGIKTAKIEKFALIEVGITHIVFFLTLLALIYVLLPFQSFTHQRFTVISGPIAVMLIPLTLLIAIHLPLSSIITCVCKKYRIQTHAHREYDQTTLHRISDWSGIQQPSHTTWDPLHSSVEISEVTSLARDKQRQNYGTVAHDQHPQVIVPKLCIPCIACVKSYQ